MSDKLEAAGWATMLAAVIVGQLALHINGKAGA